MTTFHELKTELLESKDFVKTYLKNPLIEIKNIPDWSWKRIILLQVLFTMLTGALSGLFAQSKLAIFFQLFATPILTFIMLIVSCFFFYYTFQIVLGKTVSFRQLSSSVFFANIPFFIFQIVSTYFSPILLVGFAFSAVLLTIVFVDRHHLPKKQVVSIITLLYSIFFVMWLWGRFDGSRIDKSLKSEKIHAPEVKLGE